MRLTRVAQQLSLRAVDGSYALISSTTQTLRHASTGMYEDGPAHAGQGSLIDGSSSKYEPNCSPGVKSLRNPRRIEFYHRRHREVKKFEKKQDRIHHLRAISSEKHARGQVGIAQAAAAEAERLESPWLASNIPVKPPTYASVGQGTCSKTAVFDESVRPNEVNLDLRQETKSLDVLNFKVGYAVDAQYALPDEVKAFLLDQTTFCLYGVDKNQVTQIASNIRRIRPPEPYKGAGIRIVGESIKLKERKIK